MTARFSGDPTLFSGAQASSWSFNTTLLHIDLGNAPGSSNPQTLRIPIDSTVDLRGCRQFAGNQAALPHKYPRQPPIPFGSFSPLSSSSPPLRTHRAPSAHRISTELDGRYVQPVVFLHGPSRQSLVCQRLLLFFLLSFRRSFDRAGVSYLVFVRLVTLLVPTHAEDKAATPRDPQKWFPRSARFCLSVVPYASSPSALHKSAFRKNLNRRGHNTNESWGSAAGESRSKHPPTTDTTSQHPPPRCSSA